MAQVSLAPSALDDLTRLFDFLAERDTAAAQRAMDAIEDGVMLLARHPEIGRPLKDDLRELVISHGATGYVALYSFFPLYDLVTVFKVKHQRELGYRGP
jgi:plasmid stabilization system protein ParE